MLPLTPSNVIWWRFGKEHEASDPNPPYIRRNPAETVTASLELRLEKHRQETQENWRIWQAAPNLIVERAPQPYLPWAGPDTFFHYLLDQGITVMENFHSKRYGTLWYIHICDFFYDEQRACWVMKDLFTDIFARPDHTLLTVYDLDDLGDALELEIIDAKDCTRILRRTNHVAKRILDGGFPFPEITVGQAACRQLGWMD